jgi:hypothetical protein
MSSTSTKSQENRNPPLAHFTRTMSAAKQWFCVCKTSAPLSCAHTRVPRPS